MTLSLMAFFWVGCESDRHRLDPRGGGYSVISAYINGQYWSAPDGYVEEVPPFGLAIRGVGDFSEMYISISPYQGPQFYSLDGITTIGYSSGGDYFQAIHGEVQISHHGQDRIEGYFHGDFVSQTSSQYLSISDGSFSIPLY